MSAAKAKSTTVKMHIKRPKVKRPGVHAKSTNILQEQGESAKKELNVLFIGDQEIKERNSFAKRLIASRQITGEIKFKYKGNSDKLLELLQGNIADNYDLVVFFCSGVYESKEYNETILNFEIAISTCHDLDIPFITFTLPGFTYKKDKEQQEHIKELEPYRQQVNQWIKQGSSADYVVDLDLRLDERPTFFTPYGDRISSDGHAIIVRKLIPIIKKLDINVDDAEIDTTSINKLITGKSLRNVQLLLAKLGYKIDRKEIKNNEFGLSTKQALSDFQLKNGLLPTGDIDLKTVKRLKSSDAIPFIAIANDLAGAVNLDRKKRHRTYKHMSGGVEINRQVFLDLIAWAEGTDQYPNDGYYTLFTGKQFDSLAKHPKIRICAQVKGRQICSDAAGRYGFMGSTWDGFRGRYPDFSEESQDAAALSLLSPELLQAVDDGEWETAIMGTNSIWASFPGDVHNQQSTPRTMESMLDFIEKRMKELGGDVETKDDEGNIIDDLGNVIKTAGAGLLALGTIAAINYAHKLEYTPSSGFRTHARPSHNGIDYHASKGTPVVLAQGGEVVKTATGCGDEHDEKGRPVNPKCGGGWGNHVQLRFDDGAYCIFAHFTEVGVSPGDVVEAGTVIGTVGDTGHSYGAHLHFEYIAPGSSAKSAGTPEIAERYFGFGSGGYKKEYESPNTSKSTKTDKKSDSLINSSKSIVIGDSLTPNVARQCDANLINEKSGISSLWESGRATGWLANAVANYNIDKYVKNVVISIGTNDIYSSAAPVSALVSNLETTFPNAKLLVVQGTYGNKVNWSQGGILQTVTQKQVDAFYDKFRKLGVTVITPAIGNVPNAHESLPIFRTIGANINKNLK